MYILPNLKGVEIIKYLRKSRKDDPLLTVEEVLANHDQEIEEWLRHNLPDAGPIPPENVFKEVVSGETIEDRPRMREILRIVESPKIKAIVCKEPSRLSRGDLMDIGYLVKILRYTGTLVLTPRGSYDLRDDRDREQFERELMRGNDYLEYQKKILKDGKLLAVKNGNFIGSVPPYGYKKVTYKEGKTTCHTLEPHPEEAPAVKRIFQLYKQGMGTVRICDVMEAEHFPPPKDMWKPGAIVAMLKNVHYIGKVRWNYQPTRRTVEDGEVKKRRFIADDYLIFDGKHPALIDMETWDAVQNIKGSIPKAKRSTGLHNPLAGLICCSQCGRQMVWKQVQRGGKIIGDPRILCGNHRQCSTGSGKMQEVLDEVIKALTDAVEDFEIQIERGTDNSADIHKQLVERLEKRLSELRDLEIKQWDEKTKGGMPDHVFNHLNAQTLAEIEEVSQALCVARDAKPQQVDLKEKVTTFRAALDLLKDPDAPVEAQNKLLKKCIEQITYSRPPLAKGKGYSPPFNLEISLRV